MDNDNEEIDYYDIKIVDSAESEELKELEESEETKIDTLSLYKKKKKNMYFDEELVKHLLVDVYQPTLVYGINEKGKRVCISRENADREAEKEIMSNLLLIANAIINKYSYWRFAEVDDLQAECLKAMYSYLPNFKVSKGTAFNLFSIICKRHLLNYTLKQKNHRLTADIDICQDVEVKEQTSYDLFFEDIERTFLEIIDRHYIKEKRKKYIELTSILMEYLDKNKKIVGKNDLISAFREYGYKSSDYKKFIEEMSKYRETFEMLCQ